MAPVKWRAARRERLAINVVARFHQGHALFTWADALSRARVASSRPGQHALLRPSRPRL